MRAKINNFNFNSKIKIFSVYFEFMTKMGLLNRSVKGGRFTDVALKTFKAYFRALFRFFGLFRPK